MGIVNREAHLTPLNRRLLDTQMQRSIEEGTMLNVARNDLVLKAILALLTADGLSE
jgi:ATP-dependent RNA helicase DHX57